MASAKNKITFGVLLVVFGAAVALVASAYVVDHGYNKILAAVVAGVAFPVVPVAWHAFGEHRRKKRLAGEKTPSKSMLTGYDRYWLRFVAVALVVLGPMFAASKLGVFSSAKRQLTWWLPIEAKPSVLSTDERLLRHVPADAEGVVMFRGDGPNDSSLAIAWSGHDAMIVAEPKSVSPGETVADRLVKLNAERTRIPGFSIDELAQVPSADGLLLVATGGWSAKVLTSTGPAGDVRAALGRAPATAEIVLATAAVAKENVKSASGWVRAEAKKLVVDARVELTSADDAAKLVAELEDARKDVKSLPDACRDPATKIADGVHVSVERAVISFHAELDSDAVAALVACAVK